MHISYNHISLFHHYFVIILSSAEGELHCKIGFAIKKKRISKEPLLSHGAHTDQSRDHVLRWPNTPFFVPTYHMFFFFGVSVWCEIFELLVFHFDANYRCDPPPPDEP